MMLEIDNLQVSVEGKSILKGLSLNVKPGEVHAIMGPNGSGKSTLAQVLSGKEGYHIDGGSIKYQGKDITEMTADERARDGIFLAFQYPVELPGVSNINFLKTALNAVRESRGESKLDAADLMQVVKDKLDLVKMDQKFLYRSVNEGFSGGEKKRNEILQMAMFEPKLALLDETDSGLDIDALKIVADGINTLRSPERSMVVITHYQRLLDYITPDYVHVLADGRIVKSGDKTLALTLEEQGYSWLEQ